MKSYKMVNHTPFCGLRFTVFGFVVAVAVAAAFADAVAVQMKEKRKLQLVPQRHQNRKPQSHLAVSLRFYLWLRSLVVFELRFYLRYTGPFSENEKVKQQKEPPKPPRN